MYTLSEIALNRVKKDGQLKALIAINMNVSPQSVERWLREGDNPNLTNYTVLQLVSKAMNLPIEETVNRASHGYELAPIRD